MGRYVRTSTGGKLALPAILTMGLLGIVSFGVLPTTQGIARTRASIVELQADIKDQKAFIPIYVPLQRRKQEPFPEGISVNELQPLKVEDLAELPDVFETLARESNVDLVSVTPQVRSLQGGREMLRVDARMRGEFPKFNKLLNRLNEMTSVDSIESLAIDVTDMGHEMNLSIWLAIQ
ncbi:MAG: hypothetical protein ACSHYF_02670 [Verrucomicrobiaceae bacterium]